MEDTDEVRPLIGFRWNIIKPEKRVFLRTQVKYEHRFFASRVENENTSAGRIRTRVDLFVPITQKNYSTDKNLYGILWTEVFKNFDNTIGERYQSSFRQYIGLGYRFSYSWRLEVDYVLHASRDSASDDDYDTISNNVFITIKYYIPK